MSNRVREDFEAWFFEVYGRSVGAPAGNIYFDDTATFAWGGWEASRAELIVKLPEYLDRERIGFAAYDAMAVERILEDAGVKFE